MGEELLLLEKICKSFPGVKALDNVSFNLRRREVHALLGENGAGKSTLMKVLAGAYKPDSGKIFIEGEEVKITNTMQARQNGIGIVYQELELIPKMSIAENLFLGEEKKNKVFPFLIDRKGMAQEAQAIIAKVNLNVPVLKNIESLSVAHKQLVEIAKALSKDCRILILDEPTSALEQHEIDCLFDNIRKIREEGVGIVYISHKLDEIFAVSDRVTVLRDGQNVTTFHTKETNHTELVNSMIGRELKNFYPRNTAQKGELMFQVKNINHAKSGLKDISIDFFKGEVVGIFGLMGAGKTEFAKTVFGSFGKIDEGAVIYDGKELVIHNNRQAIRQGIGLIPEDRRADGIVSAMSVKHNMSIPSIERIINKKKEQERAAELKEFLSISTPSLNTPISSLSGGNQQKVIIARWLYKASKVFICDEPTRGIDVGAKVEVYKLINKLCEEGSVVIFISSELPEILGISDRIVVFHEGMVSGEISAEDATEAKVMTLAVGGQL
jgi:ribose transport system ATP-binding protein